MKPPKPTPAATAAIKTIWANLEARAGLECLGEVEQRTAQHMRRELAAIIDRQMASKWQPISTAPKDGTTILTMHEKDLFPVCAFCMRQHGKDYWMREIEGPEDLPRVGKHDTLYRPPTHWMPLPLGHVTSYSAEDVNWSAPVRP